MALSFVAASSAWVSGTGAVTPTAPAGLAVGDLVVLVLVSKYENAVLPSDPAGWDTPGTPAANTGRPTGNDNGNTRMRLFYRVWQSGDTMPSLSPTPNNVSTVMAAAYRSGTGLYDVVAIPMADDTVGTPLAVTTPAIDLAVGDHLLTVPVVNGDAPTWGTTTVTAPGITFGAATSAPADASTASGTDLRMRSMTRAVTAGTASAAVTVSTALAGTTTNAVGTVAVVRVREQAAVAPTVSLAASASTVQVGNIVTLTPTATGVPAPSLSWDLGGGVEHPGDTPPAKDVSWSTPGTKTVTVTATNSAGSVQDSKSVTVTVTTSPLSSFTDDFASGMTKWAGGQSGFSTVSGRAEATVPGTAVYHWARTAGAGAENLIAADTTLVWQMSAAAWADGREQQMGIYRGEQGSGRSGLLILQNGDYVLVRGYNNDAFTNYGEVNGVPLTQWWRAVFTTTTVTVSRSDDGFTWTQVGTGAWAPGSSPVRLELAVGAWQVAGTFTGWFDNINLPPTVVPGQVWNGTSWQAPEVWNGTRWVPPSQVEVFNGTAWVPMGGA